MKLIEWPKSSRNETLSQTLLPELELTAEDYGVAGEALSKLDDCFFEIVFVHEVAARHCRERQLRAELLRNPNSPMLGRLDAGDFINQYKKPTRISQFAVGEQHHCD
jgi:hypothetical protein